MDPDVLKIVGAYIICKRRRRQKKKKLHVHPIVAARLFKGAFVILFSQLREDSNKFFNYFRMSIKSFDELESKLDNKLTHSNLLRLPIPPIERLALTLRFLATGNSFTDLHYTFRMGISTISGIVNEVCTTIWELLREECLPEPTTEMWLKISVGFEQYANFPNCLGAIDGKHIRIVNPRGGGSIFFNYKKFYSIVLLAMCDADYCFTCVNIGSCGKNSDAGIFSQSSLFRNLQGGNINIPGPKPLTGTNTSVQHVIVGDGAFGISKYVLKPYIRKNMTHKKKVFNYRLSRARRYIESSFGIMSNKFRVFHTPLNVSFELAKTIVKACVILHNYIRVRDGYREEDTFTVEGMEDLNVNQRTANPRAGNRLRELYADYFVSEIGKVPWQDNCIF